MKEMFKIKNKHKLILKKAWTNPYYNGSDLEVVAREISQSCLHDLQGMAKL
jgi:hypothetical protein